MRFITLLPTLLIVFTATAQGDSLQTVYGIKVHTGQTFAHTNAVNNIKGAKPFGFEIEMAKQHTNFKSWNLSSAYVKSGWALAYYNYNNQILGHGIIASRFIEPQYRITNNWQFLLKASIGAAYLSNPNDVIKNPVNNNYALHLNPYLHIGTGLNFHLSKNSSIALIGNFHHISNGNLQQPNKGLNWLTGALSFNYYPNNNRLPKYKHVKDHFWNDKKIDLQVGLFFVPRQGYFAKYAAQRDFLLGINTQVTKQVGRTSAFTLGTEIYYDDFVVDKTQQAVDSKLVLAFHAGHVFLLGKVKFSQQIGYNVYSKFYFIPKFYNRWGLDYQLSNHYSIGANLKANSDNADFFDVRLSYKF